MTRNQKMGRGVLLLLVVVGVAGAAWAWWSGSSSSSSGSSSSSSSDSSDPADDVTLGQPSTVDLLEARISDQIDLAQAKLDEWIRGS